MPLEYRQSLPREFRAGFCGDQLLLSLSLYPLRALVLRNVLLSMYIDGTVSLEGQCSLSKKERIRKKNVYRALDAVSRTSRMLSFVFSNVNQLDFCGYLTHRYLDEVSRNE